LEDLGWQDVIKMIIGELECDYVDWVLTTEEQYKWQDVLNTEMKLQVQDVVESAQFLE
jgi:hypothetical protein